jgi:tetratricopeptide (TPR) repeat protein
LERALSIYQKNYGRDHICVTPIYNNLALAYGINGDAQKKKELLERTLKIQKQFYGNDHVEIAYTLDNLGAAYNALGNILEAKNVLEHALEIKEKYFGKNHMEIAKTLTNLASTYSYIKDWQMCKKLLKRLLEIKEKYYREGYAEVDYADITITLLFLAEVYGILSKALKRKAVLARAYNNLLKSHQHGENNKLTLKVKQKLDEVTQKLFIVSELKKHTELHPKDWQAWLQLGYIYYQQENLAQAIKCYVTAIKLAPEYMPAHHNLACFYFINNEYILAEEHFNHALIIKDNAAARCDYGLFLLKQAKYEDAVKNFLTAISFFGDGSLLIYGKLEINILDNYLKHEINCGLGLRIEPFFIAHYWLIYCFHQLKDLELSQFYINKLEEICQMCPFPLYYRILGYAYSIIEDQNKAHECLSNALSAKTEPFEEKRLEKLNLKGLYLQELSKLIKTSPTILRYRILSYCYQLVKDSGMSQKYTMLALSYDKRMQSKLLEELQKGGVPPTNNVSVISLIQKHNPNDYSSIVNREPLHNINTVKIWLKDIIPPDVKVGSALSQGDCFFDAIAQNLNQRTSKEEYTIKSLRLLCDEYAKDPKNTWLAIANKIDREDHNSYLVRIQFTAQEMAEKEKLGLKLGTAVWGRPKVEGRIICEKLVKKLHVIEIQENGTVNRFLVNDKGEEENLNQIVDYNDSNILHIINYHNHFVPLIVANAFEYFHEREQKLRQDFYASNATSRYSHTFFNKEGDSPQPANIKSNLKLLVLSSLLQKSKILLGSDKSQIQIQFDDYNLAQQFAEELYKLRIGDLNKKVGSIRPQVTIVKIGNEEKYALLLTQDEYEGIKHFVAYKQIVSMV